MKSANTAIVQEPPLQDCGRDVSGTIIQTKEHFPEKFADVVHNEYQGSDGVTDNEDFDVSEFGWEGASDDCALNKGFRKCV